MARTGDIDMVVFDIIGTLVDEYGGLRAAIRDAAPAADDGTVENLLTVWQQHVSREQQRIAHGQRAYASSEVIDEEAAQHVAHHAGVTDPATTARLATATQRLPAWGDSVAGLERLARHYAVVGLSNAGRAALLRLNANTGLRWHQALSTETVQAYKPAPEAYQLAINVGQCSPGRMLMVAAHAWDLRGAQAQGIRTAYVDRAGGDPPATSDAFDLRHDGLDDLVAALT